MDFQRAVDTLKEMFPKRSSKTIEHALRESRGSLEVAISRLLPEEPRPAPSRPGVSGSSRRANPAPPPQAPAQDHIFPPDFLRWPSDVTWVKVSSDAFGASPLQGDDDVMLPDGSASQLMHARPVESLKMDDFSAEQQQSGWSKLKSKFLGASYAPI